MSGSMFMERRVFLSANGSSPQLQAMNSPMAVGQNNPKTQPQNRVLMVIPKLDTNGEPPQIQCFQRKWKILGTAFSAGKSHPFSRWQFQGTVFQWEKTRIIITILCFEQSPPSTLTSIQAWFSSGLGPMTAQQALH